MDIGRITSAMDKVDDTTGPAPAATRPDVGRWYFAAAMLWFEVVGILAVAGLTVMSPFACWGDSPDPSTRPSPCSIGSNPLHDTAVMLGAVLIAMGVAAAILWVATIGRPRWRAIVCTFLGLVALAPFAIVVVDPALVLLPALWTGVPALLLLGAARATR